MSQSTIKMDKGYYKFIANRMVLPFEVAIHNKNGQGLLRLVYAVTRFTKY